MIVSQDEEKEVQSHNDDELPVTWDMPTGDKKVVIMIPKKENGLRMKIIKINPENAPD